MYNFRFLFLLVFIVACKPSQNVPPSKNITVNNNPIFLFIGDSLTAGKGVDSQACFVSLLQNEFEKKKLPLQTKNAGISRETSSGTIKRFDSLLAMKPTIIFICIGSNDGLRGRPIEEYQGNLEQMILKAQKANIKIILGGIKLYITKGNDYFRSMEAVPANLAKKYSLLFYPFLLEGAAGDKSLFLRDGMHPNPKGHQIVFERLNEFFKNNQIY